MQNIKFFELTNYKIGHKISTIIFINHLLLLFLLYHLFLLLEFFLILKDM